MQPAKAPAAAPVPNLFQPLRESRISIVVPVFNEAHHVVENLELLLAEVAPYFSGYEIIVVSDGSTDGTHERVAEKDFPNLRLLVIPKNTGKGHAVRTGFKAAQGDYLFFIDGGMELDPKELRIFLGLMCLYEADVVLGSKRHPQSEIDYSTLRRMLSFCYQRLVRSLFDLDVTDTQVGMKLFRRAVVDAVKDDLQIDGYGFDLEILALARRAGFKRFLEAPINMRYFAKNRRGLFRELRHVFGIAIDIGLETLALHRRLRRR